MEEAFMTEFSNCSSLEEQVNLQLGSVLYPCMQVLLFYTNPDISGMLKERLHLAESGKDEEVAKKVKMDNLIKIFEDILFQGKEQGNLFFQKGKNNEALKHYNRRI